VQLYLVGIILRVRLTLAVVLGVPRADRDDAGATQAAVSRLKEPIPAVTRSSHGDRRIDAMTLDGDCRRRPRPPMVRTAVRHPIPE